MATTGSTTTSTNPTTTNLTATTASTATASGDDWHGHRSREAQMTVETVRADSLHALIRVDGELDMGTAAPLWAVLRGHLASGRRFLRLDVHGLRFLDATALSGVVAVHRDALAARGTLILTGVQSVVGRVLSLTGLDDVLFIGGPRADLDIEFGDIGLGAGQGLMSAANS